MGFALWLDRDTAWCAGTHEYRPMGVAVIAAAGLFTARDFHRTRPAPSRLHPGFQGLFGSLVHVNAYLAQTRSQRIRTLRTRATLVTKQIL
ncbi:MAG: hypothetical protein R2762_17705 [Bryobacteraceae bacterium]